MKQFTSADIETTTQHPTIYCIKDDLVENPLWYHKRGLLQTATGYGRKLVTDKMIHFNGRLRRIYCCIYSNSGSCYIIHEGKWLFIDAN